MKTVEIVVPVYNEEEGLYHFYQVLNKVTRPYKTYTFSFLFVDDGSKDGSLRVLKEMARKDNTVRYLSFSRNFGKEAAIYAGLRNSTADLVILIDADLQHPPQLIPAMLRAVSSGAWDACGAKRKSGLFSRLYTGMHNKLSTVKLKSGATDFMCMSRKYVDAVMQLSENQRFSKGLFAWVGFRVKWIDYEQNPRERGKSKWTFRKLLHYAADGITGFSLMPLGMVTLAGCIVFLLSLIYILAVLIRTMIHGIDVPGYVTTLVAVLFLGSIVLLSVGVLGSYIGRIFLEAKNRPLYIANETNLRRAAKENDGRTQISRPVQKPDDRKEQSGSR